MSKTKGSKQFCRVCLKELQNSVTSASLMQTPHPVILLKDDYSATSYLECYYYCMGKDFKNMPSMSRLKDYEHICMKCLEAMLRALNFIYNSQTSENFLMSMFGSVTGNDEGNDGNNAGIEFEPETKNDESTEVMAPEEYLELTDNVELTTMVEEYLYDTQSENDDDDELNQPQTSAGDLLGNNGTHVDNNDVEAFEEIIIETANNNCELEQTVLDENDDDKPLERFMYFNCKLCTQVFNLERQLYEHYDNEHDQKLLPYICDVCQQRYVSFKALRYHRHKIHKNFEYADCEVCGKLIVAMSYDSHKEQHMFGCKECDQNFKSKYSLEQHLRIDHPILRNKRYDCEKCDRHFFSSENLKLHMMSHDHSLLSIDDRKFSCYICRKSFDRPIILKQHLQWHRGDTMKCPHCNKEYTRLKDIEKHVRLHIRDFPFKCKNCEQRFAKENHLLKHMVKHRNAECYSCPICHQIFVSPFSLRQHLYEHSGWPLTCNLCDKGCASLYIMRRHLKTKHLEHFQKKYSDDQADTFYKRHKIKEIFPKADNGLYLTKMYRS